MGKCVVFHAVLLALFAKGLTIDVLVGDRRITRTQFSVGESLTLICNGNTMSYFWQILPIITGNELVVSSGRPTRSLGIFTATYISMTETRLQFNVPQNLKGAEVICWDFKSSLDVSTMMLKVHDNELTMIELLYHVFHRSETYFFALMGVSAVSVVLILTVVGIIVGFLIKVKQLKKQLKSHNKNIRTPRDERKLEMESQGPKFKQHGAKYPPKDETIGMVDCLAYGNVPGTSSIPDAKQSNAGTSVYEDISEYT